MTPHIQLTNVLYVPDFYHNHFSAKKLLDQNNLIATFDKDSCIFQDLSTEFVQAVGKRSNGLYRFFNSDFSSCQSTSQQYLQSQIVHSMDIIHAILGHVSLSKLKHLSNKISCSKFHDVLNCVSCILEKHHKLPFNDSLSIAPASFHLLHIDLWGPYQTPNLTGGRYFLII